MRLGTSTLPDGSECVFFCREGDRRSAEQLCPHHPSSRSPASVYPSQCTDSPCCALCCALHICIPPDS